MLNPKRWRLCRISPEKSQSLHHFRLVLGHLLTSLLWLTGIPQFPEVEIRPSHPRWSWRKPWELCRRMALGKAWGKLNLWGYFMGNSMGKFYGDIFWDKLERILQKNTSLADGLNILTTRRSKTKNRQWGYWPLEIRHLCFKMTTFDDWLMVSTVGLTQCPLNDRQVGLFA